MLRSVLTGNRKVAQTEWYGPVCPRVSACIPKPHMQWCSHLNTLALESHIAGNAFAATTAAGLVQTLLFAVCCVVVSLTLLGQAHIAPDRQAMAFPAGLSCNCHTCHTQCRGYATFARPFQSRPPLRASTKIRAAGEQGRTAAYSRNTFDVTSMFPEQLSACRPLQRRRSTGQEAVNQG